MSQKKDRSFVDEIATAGSHTAGTGEMPIARHRWYLARYQQVNRKWEMQVVHGKSWDALWKAREAAREIGGGFAPLRGEILKQQPSLVYITESGEIWPPKESEVA